jgi:hypothetical protein
LAGRNAKAIWQDLVSQHGFGAGYASVKRFVRKLTGARTPEERVVIETAPGREAQVDYGDGPMVRHLLSSCRQLRTSQDVQLRLGRRWAGDRQLDRFAGGEQASALDHVLERGRCRARCGRAALPWPRRIAAAGRGRGHASSAARFDGVEPLQQLFARQTSRRSHARRRRWSPGA